MADERPYVIERLESRRLLSAAPALVSPIMPIEPIAPISIGQTGTAYTLNLQAGVAFTGEVAFIPAPALALSPSATIDWGDGATSSATVETITQAGVTGYDVIGSHTYADAGTYSVDTTMLLRSIGTPGEPTPQFIVVEPPVISTAIVAPPSVSSPAGIILQEVAGTRFTADLGTFSTVVPATHLRATISWGDGKFSRGKFITTGTVGTAVAFEVSGAHKYAHSGTYGISINVIKPPVGASLAIQDVATLSAVADVAAKAAKAAKS